MEKKKRKHYTFKDKLSAIQMYESGYGSTIISKQLGFTESRVRYRISQYREKGEEGLKRSSFQHYPSDFKIIAVRDIQKKFLSFDNAAMEQGNGKFLWNFEVGITIFAGV